ncbi:uncharacterized protein CXorf65 homolog isoform X1 [Leucoraja erinacea]|uniref:uncharacterized protein CXorf65 homolog isoform X1 n=1 Tax=Leucoraja erinaceus TaxID=7782 RepID=UPI0024537F72|nr:uncharacterized protein CXorf65 homolog isoform X1 [Leucoraja erinacea]XP_055516767.1 uncharacterized protein CXorf65 homolog isoform X1 [Leucoraja erinacea]
MFITVLYGDNEHALFNPYCKTQILLDYIKQNCHYETEAEIDLADENGEVKNLLLNQHSYSSDILTGREVYVLLGVNRPVSPSKPTYTPLLNNNNIVTPKFLAKLGIRMDSRGQSRGKAKRLHKISSSPSSSIAFRTDGKHSASPQGRHKYTLLPHTGKHVRHST